jgi:hypothetical protein
MKLRSVFLAAVLAVRAMADQVELADGSRLNGRILTVDGGKLKIETSFAGTLSLPVETISHFTTTEPVHVQFKDRSPVLGRAAPADPGVRIDDEHGASAAAPAEIVALWRLGAENPLQWRAREAAELARRKWSYEATVAVTGRTGASEKLNATAGFKATLQSNRDRLILAAKVERAQDKGVETANRDFAGVDYSSFNRQDRGWYVRTSLETDQLKALDLRSSSALGFTRKLLRTRSADLEFRSGGSYVYENYATGKLFNSPGLDFTFLNTYSFSNAKLNTTFAYVPAFRNFANYRLRHESGFEVPLGSSQWKLKLGLTNEYQSVPPASVDRFDTTYFTSLLLNWK